MKDHWLDNPEHWQNRADEARAVASEMNNDVAVATMRQVADAYDRLARMARQLQRPQPRPVQPEMTLAQIARWRRF